MLTRVNMASREPMDGGRKCRAATCLKVVMVYEDLATGLRAKRTFDRLIHELGARFVLHSKLWKFDLLQLPEYRLLAAADVGEADLLLIAAHGTRELPAEIKTWMDQCVAREHRGQRALVSLVDTREETPADISATCAYFREVAEKGRMDYFCRRPEWPDEEAGYSLEKLRERAEKKSSMIEEILRQTSPHSRFGINE